MRLSDCHNFMDFRKLAKKRLPSPIFNYIDGAADDEKTYRRNTQSFDDCDLIPNILQGTNAIDMSVEVLGQKLQLPIYCSPTALQRLFHHDGENAVAAAAEKFGTMFGVSSLGTVSLTEIRNNFRTPQCYQFYFHKDRGLNKAMLESAKEAGVEVMMLTVDTITGGNGLDIIFIDGNISDFAISSPCSNTTCTITRSADNTDKENITEGEIVIFDDARLDLQ